MRGWRHIAIIGVAALAAPGQAQDTSLHEGEAAATVTRRVQTANDVIARDSADRSSPWHQERVRIAAGSDGSKAAFAQAQAAHGQDIAAWRQETARPAQPAEAPARKAGASVDPAGSATAAAKRTCRTETVTGSLVQKRKVCTTAAERATAAEGAQGALRGMTSGTCLPGSNC